MRSCPSPPKTVKVRGFLASCFLFVGRDLLHKGEAVNLQHGIKEELWLRNEGNGGFILFH